MQRRQELHTGCVDDDVVVVVVVAAADDMASSSYTRMLIALVETYCMLCVISYLQWRRCCIQSMQWVCIVASLVWPSKLQGLTLCDACVRDSCNCRSVCPGWIYNVSCCCCCWSEGPVDIRISCHSRTWCQHTDLLCHESVINLLLSSKSILNLQRRTVHLVVWWRWYWQTVQETGLRHTFPVRI